MLDASAGDARSHGGCGMFRTTVILVGMAAILAGCGARSSNPVAISQPGDKDLTCAQIEEQVRTNNALAIQKAGGNEATVNQNAAAVAVGVLVFWPAMLAMDLSNSEQIELRALQDRNRSLERLYRNKDCQPG